MGQWDSGLLGSRGLRALEVLAAGFEPDRLSRQSGLGQLGSPALF